MGQAVSSRLQTLGYPVEWHSYPMPHAVCQEEIEDLAAWLPERLG
jgi:phospholipase/carboxylesterase